jgi:hypothetical protein
MDTAFFSIQKSSYRIYIQENKNRLSRSCRPTAAVASGALKATQERCFKATQERQLKKGVSKQLKKGVSKQLKRGVENAHSCQ